MVTAPLGPMSISRRQNSSCDQCRKGKRACDAVWLRDRQLQRAREEGRDEGIPELASSQGGGLDDDVDQLGPCTNCSRTNKHCTFEWVQSQLTQRKERLATSSIASAVPSNQQGLGHGHHDAHSTTSQSPTAAMPLRPLRPSAPPTTTTPTTIFGDTPASSYVFSPQDQQILMNSCPFPTSSNPSDGFKIPTSDPMTGGVSFVDSSSLIANAPPMSMADTACLSHLDMHTGVTAAAPHGTSYMDVSVLGAYDLASFYTDTHQSPIHAAWHQPPIAAPSQIPTANDSHLGMRKRRRVHSPAPVQESASSTSTGTSIIPQPPATATWDILTANRLARAANSTMIGETMMHIYHDVLEGALSCWLTEQTCPYNSVSLLAPPALSAPSTSPPSSSSPSSGTTTNQVWGTLDGMQREWGPNWSNRIYQRVFKLDRAAHHFGLRRLSPAAERKVSTALNGAVMAFTGQWAQASSQRGRARWPPDRSGGGSGGSGGGDGGDGGEEFDRTLQKSFWNQARKSLDECGEIDSFRVVFAEIIFGLTQKYGEDAGGQHMDTRGNESDGAAAGDSTSEVVEEILREDTQQIWMERATRRLHVLRRRVELHSRQQQRRTTGAANKSDNGSGEPMRSSAAYDAECRKTIDLLFWLVVMFDTISSAMTERPLTISDEDSGQLALCTSQYYANSSPSSSSSLQLAQGDLSKRWNLILAKDQQTKLAPLRWPCTEAEIARELADAAPVKVLLYRKVTRLQALIARDADARTLEEAVADALLVYVHWQALYSAIFADCLARHVLLSPRTQSWYVPLLGHWLLATILLAELVEVIDERGMGGESEARRRREEDTLARIRRETVWLVSDLARASTPLYDGETRASQLDGFHHAVNEGALLTEPWTMILLRALSKAAILLLEDGERLIDTRADGTAEERGCLQRCEDCIKALWYLGRKSDMAREVANVLHAALGRSRSMMGWGTGP